MESNVNKQSTLAKHERALRERKRALELEIIATCQQADSDCYAQIASRMSDNEDRALAQLLAERNSAAVAREVDEMSNIDDALKRLESNAYGFCCQCGTPIPDERLLVYPTATRCVTCQRAVEQAGNS